MPVTWASTKSAFFCLRSRSRSGTAIFPSDKIPVEHWYSSGWNRWCGRLSMRVTRTGARRSTRAANSPAKPPPMITTRRWPSWSFITRRWLACSFMARPRFRLSFIAACGSACRVVPRFLAGQEPLGLLGTPAAPGVGVHGDDIAEHRVDDLPRGFHGVLPGKQPAVPVERRADEPVVRADVRPGLLRERQLLRLWLPARTRLLSVQGEADLRLRPDPESQHVL